ncbi:tetratricopeptide repeat protein [Nocardioides sp. HM23]|uniref:tetratricopeptide repeat protein n=1 Tax=Nocardioides bizhenqiangii TaxID=3095076 RepID=UPI002ACAB6AE|nr:tetratricopeptide repeat protein [Nocardioides sp. HM23]MDZ5621339.1 tetratricopeptide repeat protein [Nocardioides sp. HM23]
MHPSELWDFDDPGGSEQRFRDSASAAEGEQRGIWLTQVARALGLQERYDDAHAVIDDLSPDGSPEVAVRLLLEQGRLYRSSGDPDHARPFFEEAAATAERAGLEELHVDALHMVALVVPPEEQLAANHAALAHATAAEDPRAQRWAASLLNNIGMRHADIGDWGAALAAFEDAVEARQATGKPSELRIAWWMVAWALRNLGSTDSALEIQRRLKAELESVGEEDPYVDEEIEILTSGDTPDP